MHYIIVIISFFHSQNNNKKAHKKSCHYLLVTFEKQAKGFEPNCYMLEPILVGKIGESLRCAPDGTQLELGSGKISQWKMGFQR